MPDSRTYTLKIRLTDHERTLIEDAAAKGDKKVSAYCRDVLMASLGFDQTPAEILTDRSQALPYQEVPPPRKELQRDYDPMAGVEEARRSRLKQRKL